MTNSTTKLQGLAHGLVLYTGLNCVAEAPATGTRGELIAQLCKQIGQLKVERDFLQSRLGR